MYEFKLCALQASYRERRANPPSRIFVHCAAIGVHLQRGVEASIAWHFPALCCSSVFPALCVATVSGVNVLLSRVLTMHFPSHPKYRLSPSLHKLSGRDAYALRAHNIARQRGAGFTTLNSILQKTLCSFLSYERHWMSLHTLSISRTPQEQVNARPCVRYSCFLVWLCCSAR